MHTVSYSKVYQATLALELFQKWGWILWHQESLKATQFREKKHLDKHSRPKSIICSINVLCISWHKQGEESKEEETGLM